MKKGLLVLAAILAVFVFMACTTTITQPVDVSNNPIGTKVGEQSESVTIILNAFPLNYSIDASAYKAAQNAGISRIATVDLRTQVVNKIFLRTVTYTTIVTGQ
jgi:hypothetical protein